MFNAKELRKALVGRFLIVVVVRSTQDLIDTTDIRELCISEGIAFKVRDYCSRKFHEDCEYVERLPAFHIYLDKKYEKTLYPHSLSNDSIISYIDSIAEKEKLRSIKRKNRFGLFNRLLCL